MSQLRYALQAELLKNKYSPIVWVTCIAFSLAPLMGGIFMLIMRNPEAMSKAGAFSAKAKMMDFSASWDSYFNILSQAVGVGGILVFGFVASWVFGREYAEGTSKDLLSLPTSRTSILNAKFMLYVCWCAALAVFNLLTGFLIGTILQLPPLSQHPLSSHLSTYALTTLLTILTGTPIAFFALWGKGYLAPLGFVALTLVFAQIIAATGYGTYFPWAIPGIFSGASGEYKTQLNKASYLILLLTSMAGYMATIVYWKKADHTK
jgi:ABC-type transport system involved in multi-copper enzyme maturation permease subunit